MVNIYYRENVYFGLLPNLKQFVNICRSLFIWGLISVNVSCVPISFLVQIYKFPIRDDTAYQIKTDQRGMHGGELLIQEYNYTVKLKQL